MWAKGYKYKSKQTEDRTSTSAWADVLVCKIIGPTVCETFGATAFGKDRLPDTEAADVLSQLFDW